MSSANKKPSAPAKGGDALSDKELFKKMVKSLYQERDEMPGHEETKQLLTSRDLQYRFRDMCTVTVSTVAEVMQELGYKFTFVMDVPYWVVYDKIE